MGFMTKVKRILSARSRCFGVDWIDDVQRCWSSDDHAVIMDVGANVGQTTIRLAASFPGREIHAFEPVSTTRETLCNRVSRFSNVVVHAEALGVNAVPHSITAKENS